MIKSKALKKYYGRKAYADGVYGKIVEHAVFEGSDGLREEYVIDIPDGTREKFNSVVVIEKLNFISKNNVIIAIAVVDGRTYVGHSVLNPADGVSVHSMGRKLALARALEDPDGENYILEDINYINGSDGDDDDDDEEEEDEEEIIGECEYCGNPIYEGENYVEDADGNMYCDEECLNESTLFDEENAEEVEDEE